MDPHGNIEDRRQALLRILAGLVAMAGSSATVTRALRNAVLRLLRPAESATRRLVVALAHGLAVTLPRRRAAKPKPLRGRRQFLPVMPPDPAAPRQSPVGAALPLLDPARRFGRPCAPRRGSVPSISFCIDRQPIPPPPSPRDRLDAMRLTLRFDTLSRTLADLPRQARRFARWRARQALLLRARGELAVLRRPLRFGPPPGSTKRGSLHEVHDILVFSHDLALEALADTS